jgi:hypothetical protein
MMDERHHGGEEQAYRSAAHALQGAGCDQAPVEPETASERRRRNWLRVVRHGATPSFGVDKFQHGALRARPPSI